MKKKNIIFSVLATSVLFATLFTLNSCGKDEAHQIYEIAQEQGYSGSYDDWKNQIDNADSEGRKIVLSIQEGNIVWKFEEDTSWNQIYSLDDIIGPYYYTYDVAFNTNGGSEVKSQRVKGGEKASVPQDPTKEGFKFLGWYSGESKWDFSHEVIDDITLEAKWKQLYKVSFLLDDDSIYTSHYYDINDTIEFPVEPTKEGYSFKYWSLDGNEYKDTIFDYSEDITLKAEWNRLNKVTFIDSVGNEIDQKYYIVGEQITLPQISNYSIGWLINGKVYNDSYTIEAEKDLEIKEQINPQKYTYNKISDDFVGGWNEFNNIQNCVNTYTGSDLINLDYQTKDGVINKNNYVYQLGAMNKLEDITNDNEYRKRFGFIDPNKSENYIYKITLRDDLRWDDGSKITADDFVYSMKQLLDFDMRYDKTKDYLSRSYGLSILNADQYTYQGNSIWEPAKKVYKSYDSTLDDKLIFNICSSYENRDMLNINYEVLCDARFNFGLYDQPAEYFAQIMVEQFNFSCSASDILSLNGKSYKEIKANPKMRSTYEMISNVYTYERDDMLDFFLVNYSYGEYSWDNVGFQKGSSDYEIIIALNKPYVLLDEDGNYNINVKILNNLPLVNETLYEATTENNDTEHFTYYNSTPDNSASWGPYKVASSNLQEMVLERNPYWYGYKLPEYKDLYQSSSIVLHTSFETNALEMLNNGSIDVLTEYDKELFKNSSHKARKIGITNSSLVIQSDYQALLSRQIKGINKSIIANDKFKEALSLSIRKSSFKKLGNTSNKECNGLFSNNYKFNFGDHIETYSETDEYKKAMCKLYDIKLSDYQSLDEAYSKIKYFDLDKARLLVEEAFQEESKKANGYKPGDKVVINFGISQNNIINSTCFRIVKESIITMVKGTSLEGKVDVKMIDHGKHLYNDFRAGAVDLMVQQWAGPELDIPYLLTAYLDPDLSCDISFNRDRKITIYINSKPINLSIKEWFSALNGGFETDYDFSEGKCSPSDRLKITVALEQAVLESHSTIPLFHDMSEIIQSEQVYYDNKEYDFLTEGNDVKYIKYHYDDATWEEYIKNHQIDYEK